MVLILNALNITLFTFHLKYCLLASNKCARESIFICEHLTQETIICMVALFTELSKTFKRKRFGKRPRWDLSFLFFYNVDFFFIFIWPSSAGFDFVIKICTELFVSKDIQIILFICSIHSRIRKHILFWKGWLTNIQYHWSECEWMERC